jgi:hypothetical protein
MNTASAAISAAALVLLALILGAWSLFFFRGWRVICPVRRPQAAASPVTVNVHGEAPAAPLEALLERAERRAS